MKHLKALLIKFVGTSIVLLSLFGIFSESTSIGEIITFGVLTTLISYFVGDLFILPKFGNLVATIADFGLSFLLLWGLSSFFIGPSLSVTLTSFFAALGITIVEGLFHIYMKSIILDDNRSEKEFRIDNTRYATEFSEEHDPHLNEKDKY
jgi:hypothetical protein